MGLFIDLTGQRFGRLVVIERAGDYLPVTWRCRCDCGATCVGQGLLLRDGRKRSCGCLRRENTAAMSRTHGQRHTPEYHIWLSIIQRCHNPNNPTYHHYGGRGIVVCDRWRESFENFYADMGPRPKMARLREHSIERVDNDGAYAPDNCRWATYTAQSRNRRNNRQITFRGVTRTVTDWEKETGLSVRLRLNAGWSVERALTEPPHHHYGRHAPAPAVATDVNELS